MGYPSYLENIIERLSSSFFSGPDEEGPQNSRSIKISPLQVKEIARQVLGQLLPADFIERISTNNGAEQLYYLEKYSDEKRVTEQLKLDLAMKDGELAELQKKLGDASKNSALIQKENKLALEGNKDLASKISQLQTELFKTKSKHDQELHLLTSQYQSDLDSMEQKYQQKINELKQRALDDYKNWEINVKKKGTFPFDRKKGDVSL